MSASATSSWHFFAALTVVTWGSYGVLLHAGQVAMGDPVHGRYKAFFFVGIAYVLIAMLAPLIMLRLAGAPLSFPARGIAMSLIAGVVGAVGAFAVLLALGRSGSPAVVMSIVFAGAPIVNAALALAIGGARDIRWPFLLGIALAAAGGFLVTAYQPIAPTPGNQAPLRR